MRIHILIFCWCTFIGLVNQPNLYAQVNKIEIYNATDLINIGRNKGIHEIENKIYPIDLIRLNPSFASDIIDIEFKTGFWGKHHDNNNVYIFDIPKTTMELADQFNNEKAGAKLFEYYCKLPKFIKSDTIYYIYNNLDDYLKLLVKFKSPKLIERLKTDYFELSNLAKEAPRKIYPTAEERQKTSFEESLKFKQSDLSVDCNFLALQIAGALNSLHVVGFDNSLIEKLKTRQSWPYASRYSFPKTFNFGSKLNNKHTKTIQNRTSISNYRTDIKKIEKMFADNFDFCCDSRIYEIIEDGHKAYISVSRSNGYDYYKVEIREDKTIKVEFIPGPIE